MKQLTPPSMKSVSQNSNNKLPKQKTIQEIKIQKMRIETISNLINQSCDIFNYAPKPDMLNNKLKGFIVALEDYSPDKIAKAFNRYLKDGRGFPEPADIIDIITGRNDPERFNYPQYIPEPDREPPTEAEKDSVTKMLNDTLGPNWRKSDCKPPVKENDQGEL